MAERNEQAGALGFSIQEYSCEICGMSGLTDDEMREHTRACHVEGSAQCPFCGLSGTAPAELLLHVNQAHLDYLTPENELMSFIDDQSPSSYFSADGDSDSISDYRGLSPSITTELPAINTKLPNGHLGNSVQQTSSNMITSQISVMSTSSTSSSTSIGNANYNSNYQGAINKNYQQNGTSSNNVNNHHHHLHNNLNNKPHQHTNVATKIEVNHVDSLSKDVEEGSTKESLVNGLDNQKGGQGSPLRSQLGLKLKPNTPAKVKPSPLQCPLCPYSSNHPSVLEEHINRSHFDPLSPSLNGSSSSSHADTQNALACPICVRVFESGSDLELHVNIEHRDILSPARIDNSSSRSTANIGQPSGSICPVCNIPLHNMKTQEMELHIEGHFSRSPSVVKMEPNLEKQAQKLREQREFEMLRAQYGMDDQGNFREQSAAAMQRAVYAGEMSVADYYERQVGLRAAESHGIDDGTSCTRSIVPRVVALSASSPGVLKSYVCSSVDHYASSYGDKGWGCGYRNLQMLLSSLLQNTTYNEAIYSAWGTQGPSRSAMPSISRLQKMIEAAWTQGFDVQGSEQLGCKLYNTRKWIGATEAVTVLSWLRINCHFVDFHRPTTVDGRHPELFNWVLKYFEESKDHVSPLYLQHQGHSRTIIGIEQRTSGLTLLVLDPSHAPRETAALGSSLDSLRLIRRGAAAMRAPQYQIVAVKGLIETEEQYQASKVLRSLRIPPDR